MECLNSRLSLLPPQYLGMKSLIRYGLGSEFAFTLCYGDAVQHVRSAIDCLIQLSANFLFYMCHFVCRLLLKIEHVCCGDHACAADVAAAAAESS